MRSRIPRVLARLAVLGLVVAVVVPISAGTALADVSIDGAGSTWVQIALDQWRADVARQGIAVNYQGVGSTSGRVFYYQDQVDFAASEIPFTPAYRDATGSVITNEVALAAHRPYAYMPDVAGGTSFMYHLTINCQLVSNLRLSPTVIANIFTGNIKNWNDPAIAADNTGVTLPSKPIVVAHRSEGSGTTNNFTKFLVAAGGADWTMGTGDSITWPATTQGAQGNGGVAQLIKQSDGAIGYVDFSDAKAAGLTFASIKNKDGQFVAPTVDGAKAAVAGATLNDDLTYNPTFTAGATAYPITAPTYLLVHRTYSDAAKRTNVKAFVTWLLTDGAKFAGDVNFASLPADFQTKAVAQVAKIS